MLLGLLGRLPPDPAKPRLLIGAPTWPVPAPPASLDNLSAIYPQDMGGNDAWGDCVVVACRTSLYVSWHWLCPDEPHPVVTAQDCINAYKAVSGARSAPGPGLVTEKFLDWLVHNPLHPGDPRTQALAWGSIRHDWLSIEEVNSEFGCGIYGVNIHTPQEYPSRSWGCSGGSYVGGHEIGGGRYNPSSIFANTWGYQAAMSSCFVSNYLDEHHVIIWPHVWEALSPERKTQLAADYQALTGRPFPSIPEPFVPRSASVYTTIDPTRILDSRHGIGLSGHFSNRNPRKLQVTGAVIPAGAVAISGNLTAANATGAGYLAITPTPTGNPTTSRLNFPAGDTRANGGIFPLASDGSLGIVFVGGGVCDVLLDVDGYFTGS